MPRKPPRPTRKERKFERMTQAVSAGPEAAPLRAAKFVPTEALGLRKMAEVLEQFVEPVFADFDEPPPRETVEQIYHFGAAVWNAAHPTARPGALDEVLAVFGDDAGEESVQEMLAEMAERRRDEFGADERVIASVKIAWEGDAPRLTIASTVPPKPGAPKAR